MLVDWFVVVTQIVNFLILVVLLRWLLYRPLLSLIRERQASIRQAEDHMHRIRLEAEAQSAAQQHAREQLAAQKRRWLREARHAVDQETQRALEQMATQLQQQRNAWLRELGEGRTELFNQLRPELLQQVQRVVRRALVDLASTELEEQMLNRFLAELNALEGNARKHLKQVLDDAQEGVQLQASFPLSALQHTRVMEALQSLCPALQGRDLIADRAPELLCGIELRSSAGVIGWNLNHYLQGLEQQLSTALSGDLRQRQQRPLHASVR